MDLAAVFEDGGDVSAFFADAVVHRGLHFATQRNHVVAGHDVVVKFFFSGTAKN